jgi:predicted nucleic acid-binding protein
MKVLLDTSVLVAAFVERHEFHARAYPWLEKVCRSDLSGHICRHSIAELYSILTSLPMRPRIFPEMAARLIQENLKPFTIVALNAKDYHWCVKHLSNLGQAGGIVYDTLVARAAIKSRVRHLITFDPDDFRRVLPPGQQEIILVPA